MHQLTPGDFKVVSQQIAFKGKPASPAEILDALDLEQSYKSAGVAAPIGFGQTAFTTQSFREPACKEKRSKPVL
jgi:hypothetical protein